MRGKLSSTVLKTSTGSDTCAEFIQGKNRGEALRILTARVNDQKQAEVDSSYAEFRRARLGSGARGEKIRTYNFMESRVTDHRLGTKTTNIKAVMKGDFALVLS